MIGHDKAKQAQRADLNAIVISQAAAGTVDSRSETNTTGVPRRPPKIGGGGHFGEERVDCEVDPTRRLTFDSPSTHLRLTFDSPPLTLHSPALRVSAR